MIASSASAIATTATALLLVVASSGVSARPAAAARDWYQPEDTSVASLFRRQQSTSSGAIGSSSWLAQYPPTLATPTNIPQPWLDRLYAVTNTSSFPKFGPATPDASGTPQYPAGVNPSDPSVCSFNSGCRSGGDIFNAPAGQLLYGFDDGPTEFSPPLYDFLTQHNLSATHYMIGGNIKSNFGLFQRAVSMNDQIAVHTWSHPHMTTKTNEQIVAEIGWTMQIIYDGNGGRVPNFWRPPYGDTDNRVRMIAKEVFGLECIIWNTDSDDWAIGNSAQYTVANVEAALAKSIAGPKSPGLVILEHELSNATVQVFMDMYPQYIAAGWNVTNAADMFGWGYYANSKDNFSPVTDASLLQAGAPGNLSAYQVALNAASATASSSSSSSTSAMSSSSTASMSLSSSSMSSSSSSSSSAAATTAASTAQKTSASTPRVAAAVGAIAFGVFLAAGGSSLVL